MLRGAIGPVLVAVALSLSLFAVAPATLAAETPGQGPTEIDSCTTIDRSGHYELTSDVDATNFTAEEAESTTCVEIRASDVVLDGNGHRIQGRTFAYPESTQQTVLNGVGVPEDAESSNVTVRNVDVNQALADFEGVDGLVIEGVTVEGDLDAYAALDVDSSSDVSVVDTNASRFAYGATIDDSQNVSIERGTFEGRALSVRIASSENVTLANSTLRSYVETSNSNEIDVVDNDAATEFTGVVVRSRSVLVANNHFSWVRVAPAYGYRLPDTTTEVVVRDNILQSPEVRPGVRPTSTVVVEPGVDASLVEVHGNVLNATSYGVVNQGEESVDARRNYWGHPSGPSSPEVDGNQTGTVALADPRTGALADGEGSMVSVGSEDFDTSNVCFDPWKESAETGTDNESVGR